MGEGLIDISAARGRVLAEARPLRAEPVELRAAAGRVLAREVAAHLDLPPFDSSAMDGFATRAGPAEELEVVGESRAGHPARRRVGRGEAVRISTGAVLPDGAEAVVAVERVEAAAGPAGAAGATTGPGGHRAAIGAREPDASADAPPAERIRVPARTHGDHVRRAGEDVRAGETVIAAGTRLGPAEVGVLASLGHAEVVCGPRPRVAVVVTGDELVEPGGALGAGRIHDSNAPALAAQAERAGGRVVGRALVGDDPQATLAELAEALELADVVCVSGGVSVGPHDHVRGALERLGVSERFWGVALKPGKPTWFGVHGERLVFGLPGNPVSAMVTFELFARPALERLAGTAQPEAGRLPARLAAALRRHPRRDQAVRCRLAVGDDGLHATPTGAQGSHVLTSMLGADALALVPAGDGELAAGERIEVQPLEWHSRLARR